MNKFVTFEGGEGSGKSTLIKLLSDYLFENHVNFLATREPGGLDVCEEIRTIVKYSKSNLTPKTELLLFSASRAQLVNDVIEPALNAGKLVLCDRFFDSTRVYQGFCVGIDDKIVMDITKFATNGLVPEVTFFLDINPKFAFERKGGKDEGDRIENKDFSFHEDVRKYFKELAEKEKRFVVLDSTKSPQELLEEVVFVLKTKNII